MYGYIYITTNLITGTQYIGKHKSTVFEFDKYIGSGTILGKAVLKDGRENFKCELLESVNGVPTICDSEEQLNESENYYTKLYNCVESEKFYNLVEGGTGGAQVYNALTEEQKVERNKKIGDKSKAAWARMTDEERATKYDTWAKTFFSKTPEEIEARNKRNSKGQIRYNNQLTEEEKEQRRARFKQGAKKRMNNPETERIRKEKEAATKKAHTPEQKAEYTRKQKEQQIGRHFYTDGVTTIKCKPEDVPEGFVKCKGHSNGASYICIVDGIEFLGLSNPTDYLRAKGYSNIDGGKLLRLAKNDSPLLNRRFPDLVGKITILDKTTREVLYGEH